MVSTRIFVCHDLELGEETQLEVRIFNQLRQKLQALDAGLLFYTGRASDEGFLPFLYQNLSACQWFILFQTPGTTPSLEIQTAVNIAQMRREQQQLQGVLRFIPLPEITQELFPAWSTISTFGATHDYQRALEKLSLAISENLEATRQADALPSVADLETMPIPAVSTGLVPEPPALVNEQEQVAPMPAVVPEPGSARTAFAPTYETPPAPMPEPDPSLLSFAPSSGQLELAPTSAVRPDLSLATAWPSYEPTEVAQQLTPALDPDPALFIPSNDQPARRESRIAKLRVRLALILVSILLLGAAVFALWIPLHSSPRQAGIALVSSPTVGAISTGESTSLATSPPATAELQATPTVNVQATAQARAAMNAQATASAQAATPQGLYLVTTRSAPARTDTLSAPGSLNWGVFSYSGGGGCNYSGGAYHATMPQSGFVASCMAGASNYANFLFQVRMTTLSGSGEDGGGLVFRSTSNVYYRFRVGLDGSYDLVSSTKSLTVGSSSAIRKGVGQTNVVAAAARGNMIDLYVNGQYIIAITDSLSTSGQIGVFCVDFSTTHVDTAFSQAQIWLL